MSKVQLEALLQLAVGVTMVVVAALVGCVRSRQLCGCVKALVSPRQRPVGSTRRVQEMLSINGGRDDTVARTPLQTPLSPLQLHMAVCDLNLHVDWRRRTRSRCGVVWGLPCHRSSGGVAACARQRVAVLSTPLLRVYCLYCVNGVGVWRLRARE